MYPASDAAECAIAVTHSPSHKVAVAIWLTAETVEPSQSDCVYTLELRPSQSDNAKSCTAVYRANVYSTLARLR